MTLRMISNAVRAIESDRFHEFSAADTFRLVTELKQSPLEIPVTLHPLGFVHFEVTAHLPAASGRRIRIHLWNPDLSPPDEGGQIHDHTWTLHSGVLFGSLRNVNLRPRASADGPFVGTQVEYGSINEFRFAGRYDLEPIDDIVVSARETYRIPSRIVHESTLLSPQALTLVIATPDERAEEVGPLLLAAGTAPPVGTERRTELSRPEAIDALDRLLLEMG